MSDRKLIVISAWISDKFGCDIGGKTSLLMSVIFWFSSTIFFYHILCLLTSSLY